MKICISSGVRAIIPENENALIKNAEFVNVCREQEPLRTGGSDKPVKSVVTRKPLSRNVFVRFVRQARRKSRPTVSAESARVLEPVNAYGERVRDFAR